MHTPACIVVGTGPAGIAAALCLAKVGCNVVIAGPPPAAAGEDDTRTAALLESSMVLLRNLGIGPPVAANAAPISAIRIIDDTGHLLRAPEVVFAARDVGLDAFGANVPNRSLVAALWQAVSRHPLIEVAATAAVVAVEIGGNRAQVRTSEGKELAAPLVVAADGRSSICRTAAGIGTRSWTYDQAAIATTFSHSRPHSGASTEFHRQAGPLTTVPMPGQSSSLVWVERQAAARSLMGFDDDRFAEALAERLQGLLGKPGMIGPRRLFPLSGMTADRLGHNRVVLIGEAAHVMPPIGAQGLNLSLRDAATLAECAAEARASARDIGGPELLGRYEAMRRPDIMSRSIAVDLLNRSLISAWLPASLARGLGLHALHALGPLRRAVIRQGLEPIGQRPALMRPGGGGLIAA